MSPIRALTFALLLSVVFTSGQSLLAAESLTANPKPKKDLDQKEADLIKREAALLKQLSASTELQENIVVEEPRARIAPPSQAAITASVVNEPTQGSKIVQSGDTSTILAEKERRIESLSRELSTLRNRLLLAETEVERLSAIIDERNKKQYSSITSPRSPVAPSRYQPTSSSLAQHRAAPAAAPEQQDMQVITVRAEKAHLRTGPGEENSPLMTVSRGTRLAVETRSGDWYRVISPAGTRAWVSAGVVTFGDQAPGNASRIAGITHDSTEERAFKLANKAR